MSTTFIFSKKEFKTVRGLMNHVAKCFPNADAKMDDAGRKIDLSIRGEVCGKLEMREVKLVGKQVTLVSDLLLA